MKNKKHPYDDPVEVYKGFPIHKAKRTQFWRYRRFETRHQLHVYGPTIKDVKHQIDYLIKTAQRRFH